MKLNYNTSPHIRGKDSTTRIMGDVIIALMPALVVGIIFQGWRALFVVLVSILSSVATEGLYRLIAKKYFTLSDLSAVVTGFLFALTLPATVPYWIVVVGAVFAILVVKAFCGGLGENIFNPALAARAFIMFFFPSYITRFASFGYKAPIVGEVDMISSATPLHHMVMPALPSETILDMFLGRSAGTIGEISAIALLLGGAYLLYKKVITIRIPLSFLGSVALITLVFHKTDSPLIWMAYNLLSGGVILGAIFMATDYVTSPTTALGQILYGIGCGVLTVVFRYTGLFPEGVTYSILLMNALVWILEKYTRPRIYGNKKGGYIA